MWVLLSATVRRWVIASVAIPLAAKLLTVLAERLERRHGRTRLSSGLRRAGSTGLHPPPAYSAGNGSRPGPSPRLRQCPTVSPELLATPARSAGLTSLSRFHLWPTSPSRRLRRHRFVPRRARAPLHARGVHGQVRSLGHVLAQEAIGVLVRAALPRLVRVAEVDPDVGGLGDLA